MTRYRISNWGNGYSVVIDVSLRNAVTMKVHKGENKVVVLNNAKFPNLANEFPIGVYSERYKEYGMVNLMHHGNVLCQLTVEFETGKITRIVGGQAKQFLLPE